MPHLCFLREFVHLREVSLRELTLPCTSHDQLINNNNNNSNNKNPCDLLFLDGSKLVMLDYRGDRAMRLPSCCHSFLKSIKCPAIHPFIFQVKQLTF